ncbi:MAG: DUF11 domain-containing protein, partial [Flavobacterium sp.]|nr:DUF11 domain-containing protein [Flavobacterium sp.]
MKNYTFYKKVINIFTLFFILIFSNVSAQTPGLIYEPATGAGTVVLDPNGDGYTSISPFGFTTDDQLQSEIPYVSLVFPTFEPNSDLGPGPNCGFTDFVDQGDQDPIQSYVSAANNWLFRMRMGNTSPNAKSYSILIDTDGLYGAFGPNRDPQYSSSNPGFEIEIVLSTKFGVFVYDVNNMNCTPVISYPGTTNYQKSIALPTIGCGGSSGYFYDFFVNFSDLTTFFGITPSTPVRIAVVDNMAANKSTLCNPSSASDIGGINDATCGNLFSCIGVIIDNYTPCAPGVVCPDRSLCPTLNGPINAGATSVSGTSSEPNGTIIKVYIGNSALITTTTVTGGVWTLSGISPALTSLQVIGASSTAPGKGESSRDCSLKTVGATCSANPTSARELGKSIQGVAPVVGSTINVYQGTSTTASIPTAGTVWNAGAGGFITVTTLPSSLSLTTDNFLWKCVDAGASTSANSSGPACLINGAYRVTATEPLKCESPGIWICVGGNTVTANPSFTTTPISTSTTTISGSVTGIIDNVAGVSIYLYANGTQIGTTTTGAGGAWTIGSLSLTARLCETLSLIAIRTGAGTANKCPSTGSITATVSRVAIAPIVNGPICTNAPLTSVSGTSVEAPGTTIQVFENNLFEGSTTVSANGTWTASTGINIALLSTITAKALGTCLTLSAASNSVFVATSSSNTPTITSSPIFECAMSVGGNGTNGDTISLFIDGFQIGGTATVVSNSWIIGGLDTACFLYYGAVVTARASTGSNCEGNPSAGVTVVCANPLSNKAVTPASTLICSGAKVAVIAANSESGIIYQLFNGGTASGASKLGNGGNVIVTSAALSSSTTLTVRGYRLGTTCNATLTNSVAVTVDAAPTTPVTTITQPTCTLATGTITVTEQTAGETYSFDNGVTFQASKIKSGLAAGNYNVIIRSVGGCNSASSSAVINPQPATPTTPVLTIIQPDCSVATGTITVTVQNIGETYSFDNGVTFQVSNVKSGLVSGNYNVIIRSSDGCNSVSTNAVITKQSDVSIVKTVNNASPIIGSTVTFTVVASNTGPTAATGFVVNDLLPTGYTFVSSTITTGTYVSGTGVWTVGNLACSASQTLTVTATLNATGNYANTATVTANEVDPNPGNNTSTNTPTPVPQANVGVVKTVSNATPNVGSNITFTILASNAGPSAATGVTVNDLLPTGYSFVS